MGKKKDIPEFALDQNGKMKAVVPQRFFNRNKSQWHNYCDVLANRSKYAHHPIPKQSEEQKKQKKKIYDKQYNKLNYEKRSQQGMQYWEKNKHIMYQKHRIWVQQNRQKDNKSKRNYQIRKMEDPMFRFSRAIRKNIRHTFQKVKGKKDGNTTFDDILQCTEQFFKQYIESQFTEGMTWQNRGHTGWHLEHIIPISSAKNKEQILRLNHFTNFRPLWAKQNFSKGDKILEELVKLSNSRYDFWKNQKEVLTKNEQTV